MGSEYNNPSKRHYDITMSKRTRKPLLNLHEAKAEAAAAANNHTKNSTINNNNNNTIDGKESGQRKGDDEDAEEEKSGSDQQRKSLKQLINYGAKDKDDDGEPEERSGKYCSLGHHFTQEQKQQQQQEEEKEVQVQAQARLQVQNQVVKIHQHPRQDGVRGMMSRYAKVLSHLVKAKREPCLAASRKGKTHLLRLTM